MYNNDGQLGEPYPIRVGWNHNILDFELADLDGDGDLDMVAVTSSEV